MKMLVLKILYFVGCFGILMGCLGTGFAFLTGNIPWFVPGMEFVGSSDTYSWARYQGDWFEWGVPLILLGVWVFSTFFVGLVGATVLWYDRRLRTANV